MKNILDEIVENKKIEIEIKKKNYPLSSRAKSSDSEDESRDLPRSGTIASISLRFSRNDKDVALIAEIKLKSPSSGILESEKNLIKKVIEYEEAGADCISVVTDKKYFGGEVGFIKKVKSKVSLPVLQKDFVIDPYQIYEAKIAGADAILLIAKILTEKKLKEFVDKAYEIGIEPVVEVYDEEDLKKALKTKCEIIGVNARDLENFTVDVKRAAELLVKIPKDKTKIGFSGVNSRHEVEIYKKAGAKAVLVGTALMKATDVKSFINELKHDI